jgi:hypothetical protein
VTALLAPTTYTIDPWDPGYGAAFDDEMGRRESTARLDLDVELPAASWRAITPSRAAALPPAVLFLDGVRRIDARVWVHGVAPQPVPAVAASLAVGLVRCGVTPGAPPFAGPATSAAAYAAASDGAARIVAVRLDRSLYTAAPSAPDLVTRHAAYTAHLVPAAEPANRVELAKRSAGTPDAGTNGHDGSALPSDDLSLAVQRRLAELEVELAMAWRATGSPDELLIVDGPLRAHDTRVPNIVGYVKTHHVPYLPPPQAAVVAGLATGQRSPVFAMTTSWPRHCWYLRLATHSAAPWSGVVRLECPSDLPVADAIAIADRTARVLPPLASTPHKDPRAPQNLVPIGGLERHLRHRLGDPALLYRSLRAAAGGLPPSTTIAL